MAYLDWKVGDKVVCVDGVSPEASPCHQPIVVGKVYTISGMYVWRDIPGITVAEAQNPISRDGREYGYEARRFRKVQTRKSDISIFTAMLHDQRQKVPA